MTRSGRGARPNILLIMTDQHRADHLGCYGNPDVRTPHIDALAARGTRFEQFYVNCPICMPNRIAIMTGRMPSANGSRHNGIPLSLEAVTYVDHLRAAGYRTGIVGKCHLQDISNIAVNWPSSESGEAPPAALADASRERRRGAGYEAEIMPLWARNPDRDIALPYYGFDHVRFANGHADGVHGHYDAWLHRHGGRHERLSGPANALPAPGLVAPQAWRTAMPEELYPTTYVERETLSFLDRAAEGDAPFFLHCSFPDPHHPFTPPGRYFDMYDPAKVTLPATFGAGDPFDHPYLQLLRQRHANGDPVDRGPPPFAITDETALRQILALTYGMISMVDDAIGRIVERLNTLGLAENTAIVFTSDHGDFMGDHGLMLKHGVHYEGVLRVPFIWADPDGTARLPSLGCSIDIGPTILARAGLAMHHGTQGFDLFGDSERTGRARRGGIVIEEDELGQHLAAPDGIRTRTFIDGRWRLTLYDGHETGQLFDRESDPQEMDNLWNDPAHAADRARLLEAMLREMIRLGDTAPMSTHIA